MTASPDSNDDTSIEFQVYQDESQLGEVMKLVLQDLSEPYSTIEKGTGQPIGCVVGKIDNEEIIMKGGEGVNECTATTSGGAGNDGDGDGYGSGTTTSTGTATTNNNTTMATTTKVLTGYIGMLAVQAPYRRKGIGKALITRVLQRMKDMGCTSVTLETEVSNIIAQRLYQNSFGFVREELLVRYYLNWGDAYRLRLWF